MTAIRWLCGATITSINDPEVSTDPFKSRQGAIELRFGVSSTELNTDASFPFWNDGIEKPNDVNAFLKQRVGHHQFYAQQ